jgi:hypothetical protein
MGETKNKQYMVNIEQTLNLLLQRVLNEENMSASAYFRALLIKDLVDRDMLSEDLMLAILGVIK